MVSNSDTKSATKTEGSTEWTITGEKVIKFKLVSGESDFADDTLTFPPTYTHQIFDEELVKGYKNPKCNIFFTSSSMKPYYSFTYEEKQHDLATDVLKTLKKCIPKGVDFMLNSDQFIKTAEKDLKEWTPPGQEIATYHIPNSDTVYQIRKGTLKDSGVVAFHKRIEMLVLFFIDASSLIDTQDPGWEFYFIFEKSESFGQTIHKFVGYTSVYQFYAFPDRIRKRISQVLILPPYQGKLHAYHLLNTIYNDSRISKVRDITVEGPSEAFSTIRDVVDCVQLTKAGFFQEDPEDEPTKEELQAIEDKLKICKEQARKCFDLFWYKTTDKRNESEYRKLRLAMKRKIYKQCSEYLMSIQDVNERKSQIAEMYQEQEQQWDRVIIKLDKMIHR
ncbi:hypothetical protein PROFUN_14473 [Planoprotostelium fungivorum]|uniref:Histone acetyltransferase type B catalytic subunit n=1 Tax=Planoprotostelium fungivorum TaxID=1890364 RepID=A0A2P6MZX3_9EUKA|nr:hypothetical protein PROFUN_14473 [Planoprotostelium fungivorum]